MRWSSLASRVRVAHRWSLVQRYMYSFNPVILAEVALFELCYNMYVHAQN